MFWVVTTLMSLVVVFAVALVLLRARAAVAPAAEFDLRVYRDQLKEVDRDVARGVVPEDEAERLRVEISRRILDADKAAQGETTEGRMAPKTANYAATALAGLVILGGAFGLYWQIGAPGYPDLPLIQRMEMAEQTRAQRPSQTIAEAEEALRNPPPAEDIYEAEYLALVARLRTVVAERPNDLRGHTLLARQEAGMGNYQAAWKVQARVVQLRGEDVRARDYTDLADMMVLAAGGYVSPEAEAVIGRALNLAPGDGVARYYSGLMFAQTGRPDLAFRIWAQLLAESQPDDPWQDPIRDQIEIAAMQAGVDYEMPARDAAPTRGPTTADIEASEDMTAGDRMQMIEGMVGGLAERLASQGGPPADWARLIRAYGVLGQSAAARAVWAEAQRVFPDDINRVPILEAARDAGIEQ
jgi:cytochrome c-type biogenesis protein CcmH